MVGVEVGRWVGDGVGVMLVVRVGIVMWVGGWPEMVEE